MTVNTTLFEASAPGRLDVMGGIADYSGSLVLQMPIRERTTVQVSLRDDLLCNIHSQTSAGEQLTATFHYPDLLNQGLVDYAYARQQLNHGWAAYVLGCALVLQKEKNINFKGADFTIASNVPLGKGVSSSASLEVATMRALAQAFAVSFSGTELPRLAQRVENLIVGAPCGLMDQLASGFGEPGKLLPIVCQPDKIAAPVAIPPGISFTGIDSGIRHSVGGASYGDVRCAAFMGYTIILQALGVAQEDIRHALEQNNFSQLPFGGYLCNIAVAEFERRFASLLPTSMHGRDFIREYGLTVDRVTEVKADTVYAIYQSAAHPVYENERVHKFRELLQELNRYNGNISNPQQAHRVTAMGELMYGSHDSYSRCGLCSERTDELVNLMKAHAREGIAGAKITGGGSGGTVCALAIGEAGKETVKKIHRQMEEKYKVKLVLFE
jgi:L-arabinokinase